MTDLYDLALQVQPDDLPEDTLRVIWKEGGPDKWQGKKYAYLFNPTGEYIELTLKGMMPIFILRALVNGDWKTADRKAYDAWKSQVKKGRPVLQKWLDDAERKKKETIKFTGK